MKTKTFYEQEIENKSLKELLLENESKPVTHMLQSEKINKERKNEFKNDDFIYVPKLDAYVEKKKKIFRLNWYESHYALNDLGMAMITIPEFIEFLKYLKEDYNKINSEDSNKILKDVFAGKKDNDNFEWLDASFSKNRGSTIRYNHKCINSKVIPANIQKMKDYLGKRISVEDIDFEEWLKNPTEFGLPKQTIKEGSLIYYAPKKRYVAAIGKSWRENKFLSLRFNPRIRESYIGVRGIFRVYNKNENKNIL